MKRISLLKAKILYVPSVTLCAFMCLYDFLIAHFVPTDPFEPIRLMGKQAIMKWHFHSMLKRSTDIQVVQKMRAWEAGYFDLMINSGLQSNAVKLTLERM